MKYKDWSIVLLLTMTYDYVGVWISRNQFFPSQEIVVGDFRDFLMSWKISLVFLGTCQKKKWKTKV